jgi:hypothetical protein
VSIPYFPDGIADAARQPRSRPLHPRAAARGDRAAPGLVVDVVVVHLKSRRPDYRAGDTGDDPQLFALASCAR